ncbi:MAG: DUF1549 domain-containing protein [Planctomycetaceae bacterium]|nr:DUF1549 domain-containing protein [Planctomycetaceae bacterium]
MTSRDLAKLSPALFEWLEALCEDRLSPADAQHLEQLVLRDATARQAYLAYLDLHGTLHWNTAFGDDGANFEPAIAPRLASESSVETLAKRGYRRLLVLAASVAVIAAFSFSIGRWFVPNNDSAPVARQDEPTLDLPHSANNDERGVVQGHQDELPQNKPVVLTDRPKSENIAAAAPTEGSDPKTPNQSDKVAANDSRPQRPANSAVTRTAGSVQGIVAIINEHLAAGWKVQGVEPSPLADDAEWLRRIYLDVVGHIPPIEVAEKFLTDRDARKREKLLDSLLDDPAYVRNWTVVWTNLLIGRSDSRDVNRPALQKFLRESFAKNRPWNEMVAEFISAEGSFDQNGATNFLLAHLNNQAVPATAITAKIFLGQQIGCTQCHDHPFNDWKQDAFWSFNSFFQQTKVARVDRSDATGKMKSQASALETKPVSGPTHFENRRGVALVAYPKFEGTTINEDAETNRRNELAKLMTTGDKPQVAEAFVNRMWDHFFGCGFTRPVDDMGPHNPPSHPELLDHLAREFVASGYDCKQLIRWVCLSDAYQRTSRFGKSNEQDNPETGVQPLFSRVYVKGMTAEQLYDSLLLATGADNTPLATGDHDRRRHEWLQQFVHAFQTDENDESITLESSITQALLMMISDLTQRAISMDRGTFL